jgi:hypothetical protein
MPGVAGTLVNPDFADQVIELEELIILDRTNIAGSVTSMDEFDVTV